MSGASAASNPVHLLGAVDAAVSACLPIVAIRRISAVKAQGCSPAPDRTHPVKSASAPRRVYTIRRWTRLARRERADSRLPARGTAQVAFTQRQKPGPSKAVEDQAIGAAAPGAFWKRVKGMKAAAIAPMARTTAPPSATVSDLQLGRDAQNVDVMP